MRAWQVVHDDDGVGALLITAPDRNRARMLALTKGPWEYDGYTDIHVKRAPQWDGITDDERIFETNAYIPAEFPEFYDEGWYQETAI